MDSVNTCEKCTYEGPCDDHNTAAKCADSAEMSRLIERARYYRNEMERLTAKLESAELDADRYRWLRDNPWSPELTDIIAQHSNVLWDAAIDSARKGAP